MQLDTPARACRFHPAHGALPRVRTTFAGDVRKPAVRTPTPKADPDAKQHATITNAWTIVSFFEPHGAMASFVFFDSRVWFARLRGYGGSAHGFVAFRNNRAIAFLAAFSGESLTSQSGNWRWELYSSGCSYCCLVFPLEEGEVQALHGFGISVERLETSSSPRWGAHIPVSRQAKHDFTLKRGKSRLESDTGRFGDGYTV